MIEQLFFIENNTKILGLGVVDGENRIQIWETNSGKLIHTETIDVDGLRFALVHDNRLLVGDFSGKLFEWQTLPSIKLSGRWDYSGRFEEVSGIDYSSTHNLYCLTLDHALFLTQSLNEVLSSQPTQFSAPICCKFLNNFVIVGSYGELHKVDFVSKQILASIELGGEPIIRICSTIVDEENLLIVWDTFRIYVVNSSLEIKQTMSIDKDTPFIPGDVSYDGSSLVAGYGRGNLAKISMDTMSITMEFVGHTQTLTDVKISSDMKYIISASYDNSIRLWNYTTGEQIALLV